MKKEGIFTEAIEEPQKPNDWTHAKAQMDYEMGMKPDASPREWWIYYSDYTDQSIGAAVPKMANGMSNNGAEFQVIEKIHYDALAKELRQVRHDFKLALEQQPFKDNREELAAAKAENIGNLQLIGALQDEIEQKITRWNDRERDINLALTQANARITDLIADLKQESEWHRRSRDREAKLVAALEKIYSFSPIATDKTSLLCYLDAIALEAKHALKAHKGGV